MKRLFSLLMFCLLLLASTTAMAASYAYGAYSYMRYGANGRDNASLHLIYTQSGIFASVVTYDLQDGNAPMFKGVGMLENGSLVLEDYSFDVAVMVRIHVILVMALSRLFARPECKMVSRLCCCRRLMHARWVLIR